MSNKLYYKLGLEELVEPEVTTPVVELQGSQLEVEQLHHELQEDINRVDTLRADTDALEDVQVTPYTPKYSRTLKRIRSLTFFF